MSLCFLVNVEDSPCAMGIKELTKVIELHAASAIKENEIKNYFGNTIAIDISIWINQFLRVKNATDTSHLMGIFNRSIEILEQGIKPVFVFDGTPPDLKSDTLATREQKRIKAEERLQIAIKDGSLNEIPRLKSQALKITQQHNIQAKELLQLMGIPYIDAPSEAEAQCAAMAKASMVFATASEDMDALPFHSTILIRNFKNKTTKCREFHYGKVLEGLNFTKEQVCI